MKASKLSILLLALLVLPSIAGVRDANSSVFKMQDLKPFKVGEEITLVYTKEGRYATIDISPKTNFESFIQGSYGSDIMISMVHPDAIAVQNPYQGLKYSDLPGLPNGEEEL